MVENPIYSAKCQLEREGSMALRRIEEKRKIEAMIWQDDFSPFCDEDRKYPALVQGEHKGKIHTKKVVEKQLKGLL